MRSFDPVLRLRACPTHAATIARLDAPLSRKLRRSPSSETLAIRSTTNRYAVASARCGRRGLAARRERPAVHPPELVAVHALDVGEVVRAVDGDARPGRVERPGGVARAEVRAGEQ